MAEWLVSGQWPFSCYGLLKYSPSLKGFTDHSAEELRIQAYQANADGNGEVYINILHQMSNEFKEKLNRLIRPEANMRQTLLDEVRAVLAETPEDPTYQSPIFPSSSSSLSSPSSSSLSSSQLPNFSFSAAATAPQRSPATIPTFGSAKISPSPLATSHQQPLFGHQQTSPVAQPSLFGHQQTSPVAQPSLFGHQQTSPVAQPSLFGHQQTSPVAQPSLFGHQQSSTVAQPSLFGHQPAFGMASTNVFGQAPSSSSSMAAAVLPEQLVEAMSESIVGRFQIEEGVTHPIYTPQSDVSDDEKREYSGSHYTLGAVPSRPPPREMCF